MRTSQRAYDTLLKTLDIRSVFAPVAQCISLLPEGDQPQPGETILQAMNATISSLHVAAVRFMREPRADVVVARHLTRQVIHVKGSGQPMAGIHSWDEGIPQRWRFVITLVPP
jgi:hypothetical protein